MKLHLWMTILIVVTCCLGACLAIYSLCVLDGYYSSYENARWYADWRRLPIGYPFDVLESGRIVSWKDREYPAMKDEDGRKCLFWRLEGITNFNFNAIGLWGTASCRIRIGEPRCDGFFFLKIGDVYADVYRSEMAFLNKHQGDIGSDFQLRDFNAHYNDYWNRHKEKPPLSIIISKLFPWHK